MAAFEVKMIFVNVETTGFYSKEGNMEEICQIAALDYTGKLLFCEYILPITNFHPQASERSGFTIAISDAGERMLLLNGNPVKTVSEAEAIEHFASYINESASSKLIILLGYGSDRHDKPFLLDAFKRNCTQIISPLCFVDILPFLRELKKNKKDSFGKELAASPNFQRQTLHCHLCGETSYNNSLTHEAVSDVKQLRDILTHQHFPFTLYAIYCASKILHELEEALNEKVQTSHEESFLPDSSIKHDSTVKADKKMPNRRNRKRPRPENDENESPMGKQAKTFDRSYGKDIQHSI